MGHVVHIGMHKTGSTWLQRHVFPTVEGATAASGGTQPPAPLFHRLCRQMVFDDVFYEDTFRAALADAGPRVLLSYEALVGVPWGGTDADRIADRLASVAPDAAIVLFIRTRASLVRSLYAQYVNEGGWWPQPRFEREVVDPGYLDTDAVVDRFETRFDRVLVLDYDNLRERPGDTVGRIAEFTDLGLGVPEVSRRENVSLTGWRLGFLRGWNRWCRESKFNPSPTFRLPKAGAMRYLLQRL